MLTSLRTAFRALVGRLGRRRASGREAVSRQAVEQLIGRPVGDLALYEQALRHRSRLRGHPQSHLHSNERLEFLGDAVLGFIVAEHLYHDFPDKTEGFLTRLRAKLVNGEALAQTAEEIDLGDLILMSENMVQTEGRQNQTILADALEAVIGALYLDQGIVAARTFIHQAMLEDADLDDLAERRDNFKSLLLEYAQAQGWAQPRYRVVGEEGPSHDRRFTVEVVIHNEAYGVGEARSKKRAEQKAARQALHRLTSDE